MSVKGKMCKHSKYQDTKLNFDPRPPKSPQYHVSYVLCIHIFHFQWVKLTKYTTSTITSSHKKTIQVLIIHTFLSHITLSEMTVSQNGVKVERCMLECIRLTLFLWSVLNVRLSDFSLTFIFLDGVP